MFIPISTYNQLVFAVYVTRFAKRGLSHTSNSMNLKDHTLGFEKHTKLKLSSSIYLCWYLSLTKYQVNSLCTYQSEVMSRQSFKLAN